MDKLTVRKELYKNKQVKITCVVPLHNEQEVILQFLEALHSKLSTLSNIFEILLVDDGSTDKTVEIINSHFIKDGINLIRFSRNFGKEAALSCGLKKAMGDVVVLIDADFQHPIEMIDKFIEKWSDGFDMIYGVRQNRDNEAYLKRIFTKGFYSFMKHMTRVNIVPNAGDFRLLDKKVVSAINDCQERGRFMKGLYTWVGFKSFGIPFVVQERLAGSTSWKFGKLADLAITGITAFSDLPLRVWSFTGFIISIISFLTALYIIIKTLIFGIDVPGYATILVAITFFGGIQLLSIGILGEYIARIFNEVKQRPHYIIDES